MTKIDDGEVPRQFNEQEATLPILGSNNELLQDYLATQASSVSNVRSAPTLETEVCSLIDPATIESRKLHKENKQSLNSKVNQDKADSKPQDNAELPVKGYSSSLNPFIRDFVSFSSRKTNVPTCSLLTQSQDANPTAVDFTPNTTQTVVTR